jgi:hypothetical protein
VSPNFSVFPASLNPDRLIGSVNPGYGGGLVGRHYPADSGKGGRMNPYDRGESSVDFQFCKAFPEENEDG